MGPQETAEQRRLTEDAFRDRNWKRWGAYLSERQWGTVREDYSADGEPWNFLTHDQSRSRAYRWGEDGLLGICDRQCRVCFALALWNGNDPILKERLFGLTGPEGNHGEDVKEVYHYQDAVPTHSYLKGLYKYPQAEFPYARLVDENRKRSRTEPEFELEDAGVFDQSRYFDVQVEYAKEEPDHLLIRIDVRNRGPEPATIDVLPTVWFRNTWSWRSEREGSWPRPIASLAAANGPVELEHATLDPMVLHADTASDGTVPEWLFTENETDRSRLFGQPNPQPYVKDAFHRYVVDGQADAVNPKRVGTKAAARYRLKIAAGAGVSIRLRLANPGDIPVPAFGDGFDRTFAERIAEADEFHAALAADETDPQRRALMRQAYAGLVWTEQFYYYVVREWLDGDPNGPPIPESRRSGRNRDWSHLFNRDVISMPDKWEYPWYAAWDLAFHMVPFARLDPAFAKNQLQLFLREWYQHPNGQIPAYEWALSDVNPPVHAWSALRVHQLLAKRGDHDTEFLERCFQKLLLNFTWWVNRKDVRDDHVFAGGFLGLDNIGVFDRSKPLPTGGHLEQADGTAWMAFYCSSMLQIAMELARTRPPYDDMASKFFEHFFAIAGTMNADNGRGLWDEVDGFYYDHLNIGGEPIPLRVRSLVGLIPLLTATVLHDDVVSELHGFRRRTQWFLEHNAQHVRSMTYLEHDCPEGVQGRRLLAVPSVDRLERLLKYMLDEEEFLSPFGIRSLSKYHEKHPFVFHANGQEYRVAYLPGESDSFMFGGNSNWRGPIWFPLNYLIVESLGRYHEFYGERFRIECPTGSGNLMTLAQVADEIKRRLLKLFLPDETTGRRPCHGEHPFYNDDPHWKEHLLFHEYFNAETGQGLGASHQTGWTALVASLLCDDYRQVSR